MADFVRRLVHSLALFFFTLCALFVHARAAHAEPSADSVRDFAAANQALKRGAYTEAILMDQLGLSYALGVPVAGVLCLLFGMLFGLPALRLRTF